MTEQGVIVYNQYCYGSSNCGYLKIFSGVADHHLCITQLHLLHRQFRSEKAGHLPVTAGSNGADLFVVRIGADAGKAHGEKGCGAGVVSGFLYCFYRIVSEYLPQPVKACFE